MYQLMGGAILLIVLALVMLIFRKPSCGQMSEIESESTPAGCVAMFALIVVLICLVIIGAILIFQH